MPTVRNIARGDRGVYVNTGDAECVMVAPGKTVEAEDYPEGDFEVVDASEFDGLDAPVVTGAAATGGVTDEEILAAIGDLDPYNDDHWTAKGQPGVEAVGEMLEAKVTRKDIERAAPNAARPPIGD